MRKIMGARAVLLVACLFVVGCSHWQLNQNTGDLATSLGSLMSRQIVTNLARAIKDDGYIPSQVILSLGSATTANGVQPTLALPFGYGFSSSGTMGTGTGSGAPSTSVVGGTTLAAPTLSLQVSDTWNQSWTMSPPSDPGQLGRLRELYLYVTGYAHEAKSGNAPAPGPNARLRFLCNYPVQALAVNFAAPIPSQIYAAGGSSNPAAVNVVYTIVCPDSTKPRTIYADPTFLTGNDCIVCLDVGTWGPKGTGTCTTQLPPQPSPPSLTTGQWGGIPIDPACLSINPRLVFGMRDASDSSYDTKIATAQDGTNLYVQSTDKEKYGDLAMFTHQALSLSAGASSSASGKTTGGANVLFTTPGNSGALFR